MESWCHLSFRECCVHFIFGRVDPRTFTKQDEENSHPKSQVVRTVLSYGGPQGTRCKQKRNHAKKKRKPRKQKKKPSKQKRKPHKQTRNHADKKGNHANKTTNKKENKQIKIRTEVKNKTEVNRKNAYGLSSRPGKLPCSVSVVKQSLWRKVQNNCFKCGVFLSTPTSESSGKTIGERNGAIDPISA